MSILFGGRVLGKITIVCLDAIVIETKFKILEIFTHIACKFKLRSLQVRHHVIPLLDTKSREQYYCVTQEIPLFVIQHGGLQYNSRADDC